MSVDTDPEYQPEWTSSPGLFASFAPANIIAYAFSQQWRKDSGAVHLEQRHQHLGDQRWIDRVTTFEYE
jgi:hypothetical protein